MPESRFYTIYRNINDSINSGPLSLSKLEMWANAQRDGRPAEYRWRPLFNATILEFRAVTKPRRNTR